MYEVHHFGSGILDPIFRDHVYDRPKWDYCIFRGSNCRAWYSLSSALVYLVYYYIDVCARLTLWCLLHSLRIEIWIGLLYGNLYLNLPVRHNNSFAPALF